MSIKLWLPLDDINIRNQGGGKVTCIPHNLSNSNLVDGKFGKCLQFGGSNTGYISTDFSENNFSQISASFWFYPDSSSTSNYGAFIRGTQKYGLCVDTGDASGYRAFLWVNSTTFIGIIYFKPVVNQWNNVIATYDGSSFKLYLNGNLVSSASGSGKVYMPGTLDVGYCPAMSSNAPLRNVKMANLKIFDHALTEKEIFDLYNEKTLHYACNYLYGLPGLVNMFPRTDNIINENYTNSNWNASEHKNAIQLAGWTTGFTGTGVDTTAKYTFWQYYNGLPTMILRDINASNKSEVKVYIGTEEPITFKKGIKYTISWSEMKTINVGSTATIVLADADGNTILSKNGNNTVTTNVMQQKAATFTLDSDVSAYVNFYARNMQSTLDPTGNIYYVQNPMLEVGEKDSSTASFIQGSRYCEVSDSSGFMHYGQGIFTKSASTAFGTASYSFNGVNSEIITTRNFDMSKFTISTWLRATDASNLAICSCGNFNVKVENGTLKVSGTSTSKTLSAGTWYNIVVAYAAGSCKVFVNGVNAWSGSITIDSFGSDFKIGTDGTNYFYGEIADFKLYGNQFSDSECVLLYKARATLDHNYSLYCGEFDEVSDRTGKFATLNNSNPPATANSNSVFTASVFGEVAGSEFITYDGTIEKLTNDELGSLNLAGGLVTAEFIEN